MHSTSAACLAVRAQVSSVATRPVCPMQVFISPDDDRRAGACAPLTPGGEATGSRVNRFR
jgi:hypothetical protein